MLFLSAIGIPAMLALHVAAWRSPSAMPLWLELLVGAWVLLVLLPPGIEYRLRGPEKAPELAPMGYVACCLTCLYAFLVWGLTLDARGGSAVALAAFGLAVLLWSSESDRVKTRA
jgi:hypothetical protein